MKESPSSYFDSNEFIELLNSYESMERSHATEYFDGIDISNLAEFYSSMDEDDKALSAIHFGLSIHPDDPDILIAQGHLLLKQGKSEEARKISETVCDTNCRELMFLKGSIELFDNNTVLADAYFAKSVEEGEEDLGLLADIISIFIDYAQYDYAQSWLDKATAIEPEYKDFAELQADLYFATQDFENAIRQYNVLLDDSPYEVYYWEQLVCIAYRQNDWPQALEYFEFIKAIDPMYDSMELIEAECLIETDNYVKAEKLLRKLLEKKSDSAEVMFLLGNVLSLQQRNEEALGFISEAVSQYPNDPQMYLQLAAVQYDCGKYKDAADSLTHAFNSGYVCNADNIRLLLLQLLQDDDISPICDMLISLFSIDGIDMQEFGSFLPALTMCCWQSGRDEDFKRFFSKAYDIDSEGILRLFGITDIDAGKEDSIRLLLLVSKREKLQNTAN